MFIVGWIKGAEKAIPPRELIGKVICEALVVLIMMHRRHQGERPPGKAAGKVFIARMTNHALGLIKQTERDQCRSRYRQHKWQHRR